VEAKAASTRSACSKPRADLGILARDFALGAGHQPLSEMTVDFVDALPELVIRHFAERSEMGRLVNAIKKFACQLLGM